MVGVYKRYYKNGKLSEESNYRGNKIEGISKKNQNEPIGKHRLKVADDFLKGKKPSQMDAFGKPLKFENLGCK